jgi:hypothetical protein
MGHEYAETLRGHNLPGKTIVTLTCSDGAEVFHYKDDAVYDAISETNIVRQFCDLVEALGGDVFDGVVSDLIDTGVLEEPEEEEEDEESDDDERDEEDDRGLSRHFDAMAICEGIENNFYDQEFIEHSIKKYDHKRGYCTLTASLDVTLDQLLDVEPDLEGWELTFKAKGGKTTIEG